MKLTMESLDFWGPVSNFGIPVAAVMDTQKDPDMYDLTALAILSILATDSYTLLINPPWRPPIYPSCAPHATC